MLLQMDLLWRQDNLFLSLNIVLSAFRLFFDLILLLSLTASAAIPS